ncbi:MAG: M48 family metalloprotease [Acidimicrobiales bacterium]
MVERLDFDALIAANRRDTWFLMFGFFGLLAVISVTVSTVLRSGLIGVGVALAFSMTSSWVGYVKSDSIAIRSTGAKPAERDRFGQLHNVIEGVAIAAGIPKPRVYVVEDIAPNAFATGKNPEHAAVAVTTGLLEKMSRDELEGVIAHEIAHIRNLDIRVMTVAVATAGTIAIIVDVFWRFLYFGGGRSSNKKDGNPLAIIGLIVVAILAPIGAAMLKAAVSRRREALADATAVQFTRYPAGLRMALEKLDADRTVVRRTSHATSHLWIETPDDHQRGHRGRRFNDMFDTHPPLETRINWLRAMEGLPPYQSAP